MTIHVQIWTGACNARITDMTNAGKRGKTCRTMRFSGTSTTYCCHNPAWSTAAEMTNDILGRLTGLPEDADFDAAAELLRNAVEAARAEGVNDDFISLHEDEPIRGVDAPVEKLEASGDGWRATADENGVTIDDTRDQFNEPCMITTRQKNSQAYRIARKVWDRVMKAASFHEVGDILRDAGCRLHYYCRVD